MEEVIGVCTIYDTEVLMTVEMWALSAAMDFRANQN